MCPSLSYMEMRISSFRSDRVYFLQQPHVEREISISDQIEEQQSHCLPHADFTEIAT